MFCLFPSKMDFSKRFISSFICVCFLMTTVAAPGIVQAQTLLNLPVPGTMINPTADFLPVLIKGVTVHPENPLKFDFIVNPGDENLSKDEVKNSSEILVKYFLAALTVPEKDLWVNLSPDEPDRIVPDGLGDTVMGQDMLAQDYLLKQLTASLIYPETEVGERFWTEIYSQLTEITDVKEISKDILSKVWIVPDYATVYEHGATAYVGEARLKVRLSDKITEQPSNNAFVDEENSVTLPQRANASDDSADLIRNIIFPAIEKEINEGQHFAQLRQIYHAMVLATWYKQRMRESLLGKIFVDQNRTKGFDTQDKEINQKIYDQYLKTFQQGVFDYIKEDYDPETQRMIARKYIAGGEDLATLSKTTTIADAAQMSESDRAMAQNSKNLVVEVDLAETAGDDQSVNSTMRPEIQKFISGLAKDRERMNPDWEEVLDRLDGLDAIFQKYAPGLKNELIAGHGLFAGWQDVSYEQTEQMGSIKIFHVRASNSVLLGPSKGGIRWVIVNNLNDDKRFQKILEEFNALNPSEEEVRALIAEWVSQEARSLSLLMTLKVAELGLPLGGGKGVVFIGDVVKDEEGKWILKDRESWENVSLRNKMRIARAHGYELVKNGKVGVDIDIPAPDMRTGNDGIIHGYEEGMYFYLITGTPEKIQSADEELFQRLNTAYQRWQNDGSHPEELSLAKATADLFFERQQTPERPKGIPWNGVFTGKAYKFGGVAGRAEATGYGVIDIVDFELGKDLTQKTVSVQGFGQVGAYAALRIAKKGAKVQIISDHKVTLIKEDGWSYEELKKLIDTFNEEQAKGEGDTLKWQLNIAWEKGLVNREGVKAIVYDPVRKNKDELASAVLEADVDILIPAAQGNVITEKNMGKISARYIFEGANSPTNSKAYKFLLERGVKIFPDTLANAGGVLVSSFETQQAVDGRLLKAERVDIKRRRILQRAYRQMKEVALEQSNPDDLRRAIDTVAIRILARAKYAQLIKEFHGDLHKISRALSERSGIKRLDDLRLKSLIRANGLIPLWVKELQTSYKEIKKQLEDAFLSYQFRGFSNGWNSAVWEKFDGIFDAEFQADPFDTYINMQTVLFVLQGKSIFQEAEETSYSQNHVRKRRHALAKMLEQAIIGLPAELKGQLIDLLRNGKKSSQTSSVDSDHAELVFLEIQRIGGDFQRMIRELDRIGSEFFTNQDLDDKFRMRQRILEIQRDPRLNDEKNIESRPTMTRQIEEIKSRITGLMPDVDRQLIEIAGLGQNVLDQIDMINVNGNYDIGLFSQIGSLGVAHTLIRLMDKNTETTFTVMPDRGFTVTDFTVEGRRKVLHYGEDIDKLRGMFLLGPWVNRLDVKAAKAKGYDIRALMKSDPVFKNIKIDEQGNANHGVLRDLPWRVENVQENDGKLDITATVDFRDYPVLAAMFGNVVYHVKYELDPASGKLSPYANIENKGDSPARAYIGFHPCFAVDVDQTSVDFLGETNKVFTLSKRNLPRSISSLDSVRDLDFRAGASVSPKRVKMETPVFVSDGMPYLVQVNDLANGLKVVMDVDGMPYLVLWNTDPSGKVLGVEPMMIPANYHAQFSNTILPIEPGKSVEVGFTVYATMADNAQLTDGEFLQQMISSRKLTEQERTRLVGILGGERDSKADAFGLTGEPTSFELAARILVNSCKGNFLEIEDLLGEKSILGKTAQKILAEAVYKAWKSFVEDNMETQIKASDWFLNKIKNFAQAADSADSDSVFDGIDLDPAQMADSDRAELVDFDYIRSEQLKNDFFVSDTVPNNMREELVAMFRNELAKSESGKKGMFNSCLKNINGNETGIVFAIDWGGSNLRVSVLDFKNGKVDEESPFTRKEAYKVEWTDADKDGRDEMAPFNKIAKAIRLIAAEMDLSSDQKYPVGFGFSFPAIMESPSQAKVKEMAKGFEPLGEKIKGQNPADLLDKALKRVGIRNSSGESILLQTTAVLNDTVAVHMLESEALFALILSSGFNTTFRDPETGMIYNMESGSFDLDAIRKLRTRFDVVQGTNPTEELLSGKHLGNITRQLINALIVENKIFLGVLEGFQIREFRSEWMSAIDQVDRDDDVRGLLAKFLEMDREMISSRDARFVKQGIESILERSAVLVSAILAAVIEFADPQLQRLKQEGIRIPADSTVLFGNPKMIGRVRSGLKNFDNIAPYVDQITFIDHRDETLIGAALAGLANKKSNDQSVVAPGGIDLDPAQMNLQIKRDANFVPLPVDQQIIDQIQIQGFVPIIIDIRPLTNLPMLLGFDKESDSRQAQGEGREIPKDRLSWFDESV